MAKERLLMQSTQGPAKVGGDNGLDRQYGERMLGRLCDERARSELKPSLETERTKLESER